MLAQPRQHRKARQHVQRTRRARRHGQLGVTDQLVINFPLLDRAQAIGHLDHVDAVDKGFIGLVVLEVLPLGLVGVRHDDAGKTATWRL